MFDSADAESATKMLPHLAAFVAVVESGSYTRAAKRLRVDKTLLSRRVMTLERALGVRLLQRSTRSLSLTEAGRRLHREACEPLHETLAALVAAREGETVEGTVRAATLPIVGSEVWGPVLCSLRERHPKLVVDLRASDRYVDVVGQGLDLALRSGHQPDSSMVCHSLGYWGFVLCAAPSWHSRELAQARHPGEVRDGWILYGGVQRASHWTFVRGEQSHEIEVRSIATVDSATLQMQLVASGAGIGALPAPMACRALEDGALVRVLPDWRIAHRHRLAVVLPSRSHVPLRVQTVIEALRLQVQRVQHRWDAVAAEHLRESG